MARSNRSWEAGPEPQCPRAGGREETEASSAWALPQPLKRKPNFWVQGGVHDRFTGQSTPSLPAQGLARLQTRGRQTEEGAAQKIAQSSPTRAGT